MVIPLPKFFFKEEAKKFLKKKLKIGVGNKFILGSIGRLDYPKNYEFLIKVFPEVLKIKKSDFDNYCEGKERKNRKFN